jgi:glyoxylase-like metal-dependent hydrolase (beta-lactamase superfamily II)
MITKPLPNVYLIQGYSNAYIVEFEDHLVLVDAGMDKKAKELIEAIEKTGKKPAAVLITHGHLDHINGLAKLKEKYPEMKILASEEDRAAVEGKEYLLPKGIKGFFFRLLTPFMYKPVKIDETLPSVYKEFKTINTPGHTKGSVSFLFNNVLFCGDLLINSEKGLCLPPKEFNLDRNQLIESIKQVSTLQFDYLMTGHGSEVSEAKRKVEDFIKTLS